MNDNLVHSRTGDVRLFSALASMGMAWTEAGAFEQGDRAWKFSDLSDCGKWQLKDLLRAWHDKSFHLTNPDHPFNYVKVAMASDLACRKSCKFGGSVTQEHRGKCRILIHVPEEIENRPKKNALVDTREAAAYSACGFDVWDSGSIGSMKAFSVGGSAFIAGRQPTFEEVKGWWMDKQFVKNNPQHPFAYVKAVLGTYKSAVHAVKTDTPLVLWSPPGSTGVARINPKCSAETEAKVAGWLRGE